MRILSYHDIKTDRLGSIVADKIVRLSKKLSEEPEEGTDITLIYLTTGEVVEAGNSLKTLEARLENLD